MKTERRKIGKTLIFVVLFATLAFVSVSVGTALASASASASASATTVSGQVVIPDSDMGWKPDLSGMKVRVEGTDISADVDSGTGNFTLTGVPTGTITLLLIENNQDVFTQSSKRVQVEVGSEPVTGVSFSLVYHWKELAGYPPHWGETGYGEWTPHFVSEEVGFILFRVRGPEIDPERMELYRTLDGGDTWEEIGHWEFDWDAWNAGSPYPALDRSFYFTDQNQGVILAEIHCAPCGNCGWGFFYTQDGGTTWGYAELPRPGEAYSIEIHRYAHISTSHIIAAGTVGCAVQGYGSGFYDAIWETTDAGATWELKAYWEQAYGECTALGANSDGKAVTFFTPYHYGAESRVALRDISGDWSVKWNDSIRTNSGYGPADVPMVGDTAWVSNTQGSLPHGLYQSNDAGLNWTKISDAAVQYMDFASLDKGFGLFGGKARITYDGGKTWLHQSNGGGLCCHGNDIWAFDTTHAIWHEGGAGDPNGKGQIFTYIEPWEANFEAVSGVNIKDGYAGSRAANAPMGSYKLFNHGPVPIVVNALDLSASGSGDDKADVSRVNLWLDENANGYLDDSDTFLDSSAYANDNGSIHFSFTDVLLKPHVPVYLMVTYDFGDNLIPGKTYSCSVKAEDIQAEIPDAGTSISPTAPSNYPIVTRQVTAGSAIFYDDFESGLDKWIPDNITGDCISVPWSLTEELYVSPSHSVYIWGNRSTCNYGQKNNLILTEPIDLSATGEHYLTFWHKIWMDPMIYLKVELSTDGGASWETLKTYDNTNNTFYPVYEVLDLSEYSGESQVLIRFQLDWTSWWYDYGIWYVDDVQLFDISAPKPTISIYTDKTNYTAGQKMHLGLDVNNPSDSAQRVSLDIYLETPIGRNYTLIDTPVTLPAKLDYSNPHFKVFTLPTIPAGTYAWHAILDDPVTGEIICEDTTQWEFAPTGAPTGDITEVLEQTTVVIDFGE